MLIRLVTLEEGQTIQYQNLKNEKKVLVCLKKKVGDFELMCFKNCALYINIL